MRTKPSVDISLLDQWKKHQQAILGVRPEDRRFKEEKASEFLASLNSFGVLTVTSRVAWAFQPIADDRPKKRSKVARRPPDDEKGTRDNPGTRHVRVIGHGRKDVTELQARASTGFYIDVVLPPFTTAYDGPFWRYFIDDLEALSYSSSTPT